MERNLAWADYCARHGLHLRPHTKTHKSAMLARRQLALGASGLTVAKTGEAEIMADTGTRDLLVAFPVIGEPKLRRSLRGCPEDARHRGARQPGGGVRAFGRRRWHSV